MEIVDTNIERSQISVSREEVLIMNAALNEICNGITLPEFETRIGSDRKRVTALLKEIGALIDAMDSMQD
jgi:hypothetical protein